MDAVFCKNGHSYDPDKYSSCPYCGMQVDIGSTRPLAGGETASVGGPVPVRDDATRAERAAPPKYRPGAEGETVHVWKKRLGGIDPVVGWLVCIEGPDRGRDFRIHTERNAIERGADMDIAITGDASISRENHAVLSYNPRRHSFRLAPGDGRGLTYLNDDEVSGAVELIPTIASSLAKAPCYSCPSVANASSGPHKRRPSPTPDRR